MKNKLSQTSCQKEYGSIFMFGLIGQIAWNVENMYFNTFCIIPSIRNVANGY